MDALHFSGVWKLVRKLFARALLELLDHSGHGAYTLFAWAAYSAEFGGDDV